MIPKKIHYCWFGNKSKGPLNTNCLDSWRKVLPEYEVKEWNEDNSPLDNAYCRQAHAKGAWSRLSNYVRLHALYSEGGIYLDTDVEVVKSFTPLLHHKCFVGFQQQEELTDWVNTAVMGAQPGFQFLRRCLALTEQIFAETGELCRSPMVMTTALREIGLQEYRLQELEEVTVYPCEYFYPFPWFSSFSPDCVKENTYSIHYWEGSWVEQQSMVVALPRMMKMMLKTLRTRAIRTECKATELSPLWRANPGNNR